MEHEDRDYSSVPDKSNKILVHCGDRFANSKHDSAKHSHEDFAPNVFSRDKKSNQKGRYYFPKRTI